VYLLAREVACAARGYMSQRIADEILAPVASTNTQMILGESILFSDIVLLSVHFCQRFFLCQLFLGDAKNITPFQNIEFKRWTNGPSV
jgi:hypothetical protein